MKTTSIVLIATALLFATGCQQSADLSAIIALAKSTSDSQATFASLANDFQGSCIRTVGWQRAAEPTHLFPDANSACSEEAKASQQWTAANSIVTGYVASLGALAGGSYDPGDYGLTDFSTTLSDLGATKAFTDTQRKTIVGAATSLINDYFNIKRRQDLSSIIPSADADLDTVISTLEDAAQTNYVTQLSSERIAIGLFFEPNIARARPGLERLYAFRYRSVEHQQMQTVDEHQGAVAHYVAALEQIRTTHHQIASAITSNRISDVSSIIKAYLAEYQPQIQALQQALK